MPKARGQQISLADTPYYHCVSRCVRRAFLCGEDPVSGQSYEHRREWVEKRLLFLGKVFAIEICAFAVMSNHSHVVLHVNSERAKNWSTTEVLLRWHKLHKGTLLTQQFVREGSVPDVLMPLLETSVETYRKRLMDISWFMRELNEPIARQANNEDGCTGRFWEGRFKSQALLDEAALAACMVYVDLNPVRARMAKTPEESEHTSVKMRIEAAKKNSQPAALNPLVGYVREDQPGGLPFRLQDYLELVDLTGRVVREDKRGAIDLTLQPILTRLNIPSESWLLISTQFENQTQSAVGSEHVLTQYCQSIGQKRRSGITQSKRLFA